MLVAVALQETRKVEIQSTEVNRVKSSSRVERLRTWPMERAREVALGG